MDSLVNSHIWTGADSVTLVTLGSPLKRFFFRFFPRLYFPRKANECAAIASAKLMRFRWVNCFRPKDQVGTSVGLAGAPSRIDVSTGQNSRFLSAHPNYWNDPVVRDIILDTLVQVPFSSRPQQELEIKWQSKWSLPGVPSRGWTMKLITAILYLGIVSAPLGGLVSGIREQLRLRDESNRNQLQIAQAGVKVNGTMTHWRVTYAMGETGGYHDDFFIFEFMDSVGQRHKVRKQISSAETFDPSSRLFDAYKLLDAVYAKCGSLGFRDEPDDKCRLEIEVRYLLGKPDVFDLPDFPPTQNAFLDVKDAFFGVMVTYLTTVTLWMILKLTAFKWVPLLIGEGAVQRR